MLGDKKEFWDGQIEGRYLNAASSYLMSAVKSSAKPEYIKHGWRNGGRTFFRKITLTKNDITKRLIEINWKCEVTDAPLLQLPTAKEYSGYRATEGIEERLIPSIDGIDDTKGYHMDNIQIVCRLYNNGRNTSSDARARYALDKIIEAAKK